MANSIFTNDFANPDFNHGNYIAVYPESTGDNETRGWQVSPGTALQGVNDVAFILELLEKVKNDSGLPTLSITKVEM